MSNGCIWETSAKRHHGHVYPGKGTPQPYSEMTCTSICLAGQGSQHFRDWRIWNKNKQQPCNFLSISLHNPRILSIQQHVMSRWNAEEQRGAGRTSHSHDSTEQTEKWYPLCEHSPSLSLRALSLLSVTAAHRRIRSGTHTNTQLCGSVLPRATWWLYRGRISGNESASRRSLSHSL